MEDALLTANDLNGAPSERSSSTAPSDVIQGIHYIRGLAALIVLIHHASGYLMLLRGYDEIHKFIPLFGRYGVEMFFAISGYLMATILPRQSASDFMTRRILRIYPIFLLVTVIVVLQPVWPRPLNVPSLILAPIGERSANTLGVEWTLVLEMGFYVALFGVSLAGLRGHVEILASIWLAILLWHAFTIGEIGPQSTTIVNFFLAPANIAFAIGLLLPRILGFEKASKILLLTGLISMVVAHLVPLSIVRAVVAISSACIVGWMTSVDRLPFIIDATLSKLADWSYSLYLCHVPVIVICYNAMPNVSMPVLFIAGIASSLAVTALIGPIETHLHNFSRSATRRLPLWFKAVFSTVVTVMYLGIGIYFL